MPPSSVVHDTKVNIRKLYAVQFLTGLMLWYPVEKLFMQQIGVDAAGVGVAAAVLLTVTLLFDVPSGVLADRWSRTATLLLAVGALAAATLVLGMSSGLPQYLAGTALYGAYIVLSSGTLQALMYDALAEAGLSGQYDKYQGRSFGLFLTAIAAGSLAGGVIGAVLELRTTYIYSLIPLALAFLVLLTMREPRFHRPLQEESVLRHVRSAARVVAGSRPVLMLAALFVIVSSLRFASNEFSGLYYIALGLTAVGMGGANAGKWLAAAAGQFAAARIGRERAFRLLPVLFVSFLLFSFVPGVAGLISFFCAAGLFSVVLIQTEAALHEAIPSNLRATTISVLSFAVSALMVPGSLLLGWVARDAGILAAFQLIGTAGSIIGMLVWVSRHPRLRSRSATLSGEPANTIEVYK